MTTIEDFDKLDIRVGTIIEAKIFEKSKKPAYQLVLGTYSEEGVVLNRPDKEVKNGDKLG